MGSISTFKMFSVWMPTHDMHHPPPHKASANDFCCSNGKPKSVQWVMKGGWGGLPGFHPGPLQGTRCLGGWTSGCDPATPASGSSPCSLSLCRLLCCVCVKRWACAAHFPASGCLYLPCSMSHRRTIYILVFSTFRNLGKAMSPVPLHCRSWYFSLVREM